MMVSLDRLIEDIKALEDATGKANGYMLPEKLRAEAVTALTKLLKFLGGDGYSKPGYEKPGDYQRPAYPEPKKKRDTTTLWDRERKKSVKIKFVGKSAPAPEATKAAQPAHFSQTPVSAEKYARVVGMFGEDFAARYYVASAAKSGTGYEPVETIDHYFGVSEKTHQRRLRGQQRLAEQRQREAAEEAAHQREVAGIASLFDSSEQPR